MHRESDLIIAVKTNESDIADKEAKMAVAELDLDKYLGIRADPEFGPLGSLAGGGSTLVERGEYRKTLEDLDAMGLPTLKNTIATGAILEAGRRSLDEKRSIEIVEKDGQWTLQ